MATAPLPGGHVNGLGSTHRTDRWWVGPLLTVLGLGGFAVYSTWAAFQGNHYFHESYLSPFYSPVLFVDQAHWTANGLMSHAWFGKWPEWLSSIWPPFIPHSPAFLILIFPGSFRLTCYYYRKAYYRSFMATPPGCAVGGISGLAKYRGETFLFIFQNLHRYALYFAVIFIGILYYDAFIAFFRDGKFGVGVGSIVLLVNATLLACYTFGCHSWRHLIGGKLDCFTCDARARVQHGAWKKVSWLNARHMQFAWMSLFWVGFSDLYVRLVSMGIWTDYNTWN
ncbi:MAG: succinate dehydrogenase [Acidobacteriota bacterium]